MPQENQTPEFEPRHSESLFGIVNTIQWVVIALILAFVFRAFIMEAFRIPTGSMAETLRGAHHHLRCRQCGFLYDLGTDSLGTGGPKCFNCGYATDNRIEKLPSNGDRILVLKCIYEFQNPKRYDVFVFKYPADPTTNYIKRVVGMPGETIEIVDGDIYIDGKATRKPPKTQNEMWMPVYNNDYLPLAAFDKGSVEFDWIQPFANQLGSNWDINKFGKPYFTLQSPADVVNTVIYDPSMNDDFRAYYAYNYTTQYKILPICTDLKVRYYAQNLGTNGQVGAQLRKYDTLYKGIVSFDGNMRIEKVIDGQTTELAAKNINVNKKDIPLFEFALVDRQLTLQYDDENLKFDLGRKPGDLKVTNEINSSLTGIIGAGNLKLSHISVFRDTYYLGDVIRPRIGKPFTLGEDEFFACGDNSPASFDSRAWGTQGKGNHGKIFPMGIVPREYLMGKAFFLYWGDAFKPFENFMPIIPNFAQMKIIYGGSDEEI